MDNLAPRITEKKVFENGRIFVAPTGAKDVVAIEGSVLGGWNFLPRSLGSVPAVAGRLLDAGTKKQGKDALREALAARGATLGFYPGGDRTYFSGSCLPEDLPFLLKLAAECLGEPTFPVAEIATSKERMLGRLKESKTETRTQALHESSRLIYDEAHVNYEEKDTVAEKNLKTVTRSQLVDFQKMVGYGGLVLAIAGDTHASSAIKAAESAFGSLKKGTLEASVKSKNKKAPTKQEKFIEIPEKANIDLYLGVALPFTYEDPSYLATATVVDMLGGGFAAHLMQTVRERDGLTYGISASLAGFGKGVDGSMRIWSTLSPLLFDKGIKTIRKEVEVFFSTGITDEALAKKKDEINGSYVIGLSTTHGLARVLHEIGIHDRDLSYIDTIIDKVRTLSVADLKAAAKLIQTDKLSLAAAGTFKK
jgi:zinc protease